MQRVPDTEKRGRRHSSTIAVVWLDNPDRAPVPHIDPADVRVDTYRDTGPGGQHRNTTDSAVRLTHTPTGVTVTAVEERSQHANRQVAWARLRAALAERADQAWRTETNQGRVDTITAATEWTWCGWRDTVTGPGGRRTTMRRALAGRLDPLIG